ncbi:MAG: hypothetical protein KGY65_02170 [Candidatus Thermoplasmatota archaeon]|nr:hypothetical protein [Candidatus Thermoplasmatota archaeon]
MTITETIDSSFTHSNNTYTVTDKKEDYLLKTIRIPKKEAFSYAFLGGMWYSKNKFKLSFDDISLPYPFTTYYTIKILDKTIHDKHCRSAIYVKMPVCIIQLEKTCYLIEFDPVIKLNNQDVFPFIHLIEKTDSYEVSFYLSTTYTIKQKKSAWLGRGKKTTANHDIKPDDSFTFNTTITEYDSWEQAILSQAKKNLKTKHHDSLTNNPKKVFTNAKNALWRSYDHKRGTFIQLPWRKSPGFTFGNSSYSLLSYEAIRLDYFSKWYQDTKDEDLNNWTNKLHDLFLNPALHTIPKKQGKGIIWYNMTTLTQKGLAGYFYMDTGYSGYPGGQATIDFHLLNYLLRKPNEEMKQLVNRSLQYILSTQQDEGSWPMAIKQEGILKFRPEKLQNVTSYGGTAESVRALLKGYTCFNDESMKDAALKGLQFLQDNNPICYNGLRDIGICEPEAFSAVSIINAFLDAYEQTNEETQLSMAKTYATYTLPWIYQWNSSNLAFFYNFHPISYSITPRLSPYETAWVISTYHRLNQHLKKDFWNQLNKELFNHVTSWISETGGLSEGIFPTGLTGFHRLPMEQTFATVELMNSAQTLCTNPITPNKKNEKQSKSKSVQLKKKGKTLLVLKENNPLFTVDASQAKITSINTASLSDIGISFSFYGSNTKRLKRKIKQRLRGNIGKFVIGAGDARYAITGVKGPELSEDIHLDLFKNQIISSELVIQSDNTAQINCRSSVHILTINLSCSIVQQSVIVDMNITIKVNDHDLPTDQQILFPVIGAKPLKTLKNSIYFKGFSLTGDISTLVQTDSFTAINQTLASNWTHAGICKKTYTITIPLPKKQEKIT